MVKRFLYVALVLTWVSVTIAACGDDDDATGDGASSGATADADLTVVLKDTMQFEPETITLAPGEEITINLENRGNIKHNFSIDAADVDQDLDPARSAYVTFRAPSEPGEYEIYCSIPGHEDAGMVGTLVVEE